MPSTGGSQSGPTHRRLNLAARDGGLLVVAGKVLGLRGNLVEDILRGDRGQWAEFQWQASARSWLAAITTTAL